MTPVYAVEDVNIGLTWPQTPDWQQHTQGQTVNEGDNAFTVTVTAHQEPYKYEPLLCELGC